MRFIVNRGHRSTDRLSSGFIHLSRFQLASADAMTIEPWVSVEQVAQHLGVARDTIYRWREHRGLPAHRVGRLWKFRLSEVDDWVRAWGADEEQRSDGQTPSRTA
ncbi:helix-turn-helix domain-containing protein [Metallibacterium scheffleri]|uniref:helix-turn-helix domain-containing protein n=1 Tax=Metallibacterium scheffleri TaxID=993689 RepID=UPI0031F305CF